MRQQLEFGRRYGPWAVVAGGSEGIGAAFSEELAQRGVQLILLAEREQPLQEFGQSLARRHAVEVRTHVLDLGASDSVARLEQACGGCDVGLGIYNAAFSEVLEFAEQGVEGKLRTLDVNARGALLFCHWLTPKLISRGKGGMILMSSLAALQGTPRVAAYAATKAFDLVLAESLWYELRPHGVDVLGVCAGATRTPGWLKTKPRRAGLLTPPVMRPEQVAREALDALGSGPSRVMGMANRAVAGLLSRGLGRRRAVSLLGRSMAAQYADDPE